MPDGLSQGLAQLAEVAESVEVITLDDARTLVSEVAAEAASQAVGASGAAVSEGLVVTVDADQWDWLTGAVGWSLALSLVCAALLAALLGSRLVGHLTRGWR